MEKKTQSAAVHARAGRSGSEGLFSNFAVLRRYDEQLLRLGLLAERYFPDDPNTALLKLRQLAEGLAQTAASRAGLFTKAEEGQYDLLRRLQDEGILPREVFQLFDEVRRTGNKANHAFAGDHATALATLKMCRELAFWFHRTFGDPNFKAGPFIPPAAPKDESEELKAELERLRRELEAHRAESREASERLGELEEKLREASDEKAFWEVFAAEADREKDALAMRLAANRTEAMERGKEAKAGIAEASNRAVLHLKLDEQETRNIIDEQLRRAGWEADSVLLRYAKGARPEKGKNRAIAEWPTDKGPADYVLFAGLTPLAVVEAKRKNVDISSALKQAERYSRGYSAGGTDGNWDGFRVPFAFSTNGRPFLRQLETKSGIWFRDLRKKTNLGRALEGWYTPEGLKDLLRQNEEASHAELKVEGFDYGFPLRHYQKDAILAAEAAIENGQRTALLAMATGTGKTKTCIALIYRLLKTKRFRRVLFLVDRSALGVQAVGAFKDTRMENLRTFADVFSLKELNDAAAEDDTKVHIATVQGMVRRLLYPAEDREPPAPDRYDLIVVDECHRGYLLDRELSDTEMSFRGFEDYVSKYRRVLDSFDAVKIGLTATPALHTTQIFGKPVYTYSYREAVIDGFLVDHEPPVRIKTELSESGIKWEAGENVPVYRPGTGQLELFRTRDELKFEVEDFNRKVVTIAFNQVVCDYLAKELDPSSRRKTLIFCVSDFHADIVVGLLRKAFQKVYGEVENDAVEKITGGADKPFDLIKKFKNERNPNVAVTVDLLTTGIDVPEICNLVFLRRVNSRILFDQMLGRATRLCEGIGKESFRVFDAVGLYDALKGLTEMQPVTDPALSFSRLEREALTADSDEARGLIRDQFVAKLQRKKRHLDERQEEDFEAAAGMDAESFLKRLRALPPEGIASWFKERPGLGPILDRSLQKEDTSIVVSNHEDRLKGAAHGYGDGKRPEDYLKDFSAFLESKGNEIPALVTVLTRPRELTRKDLRSLALALDEAGYSEAKLETAWRETTNKEYAARIVGYVRQAAIGDPLVPYGKRVDAALEKLLSSRPWTTPQRDWLKRIADQTKANIVVDRDAMDDKDQIFRHEGGGFNKLDKLFGGELERILGEFKEDLWTPSA